MDVHDALRRRRMVRSFDGTSVDADVLVELCEIALRAPTAGFSRGVEAVVLGGPTGVARYLTAATDAQWRETSSRSAGLALAGGAVVVLCSPRAYADRYAADDKASSGLGKLDAWPVPYWYGDAGAFTMALLLLLEERGLAACFLGAFRNESSVLGELRAPPDRRCYGTVLVGGHGEGANGSSSTRRPGPTRAQRVLREGF